MYNFGDEYFICDYCGNKLEVNKLPNILLDLKYYGWCYYTKEINYEYKFVKSVFKSPRELPNTIIECNLCIRKHKIDNINKKIQK